jgi:hypothetical protein
MYRTAVEKANRLVGGWPDEEAVISELEGMYFETAAGYLYIRPDNHQGYKDAVTGFSKNVAEYPFQVLDPDRMITIPIRNITAPPHWPRPLAADDGTMEETRGQASSRSRGQLSAFIERHPAAHLVAGIMPEDEVLPANGRRQLALIGRLVARLAPKGLYALTVDRQNLSRRCEKTPAPRGGGAGVHLSRVGPLKSSGSPTCNVCGLFRVKLSIYFDS